MEQTIEKPTLFTIGHSDHAIADFVSLLRQHRIDVIADVRSQPYSKFHAQFNRETLAAALKSAEVQYVFMGRSLGARRTEAQSYSPTPRGRQARYDLITKLPAFQEGLDHLRRGLAEHRIALMCAEKDPLTCHRTILVCRQLRTEPFAIEHVLEEGTLENTAQSEARLLELMKLPPGNLFQPRAELIEQAYDMQAEKIAYTETDETP